MATLGAQQEGVDKQFLLDIISEITTQAKDKLNQIKSNTDEASIADMFDMQMIMNRLSQASEMSTSVMSAANTATMSMARNLKG